MLMQGRAAKGAEPQQTQHHRRDEHENREFAHGAALGNAGDERADKGGPGKPPRPVEGRPTVQEIRVLAPYPVAERHNFDEIAAERSEHTAENVERRPERDNRQQQQQRENDVELAKALDPDINTRQHRYQGDGRNHHNQHHHSGVIRGNIEHIVQTGG